LRGTSFDRYEAGRWTRTLDRGSLLVRDRERFELTRASAYDGPTAEYEIVLNALDEPVLFLPDGTVAISIAPRIVQGLPIARRLVERRGRDVRYEDADGLDLLYTVTVEEDGEGIDEALTPEARAIYLALPLGQERVAALARKVTAGASEPGELAARIEAHLRSSGEYRYSVELPDTGDRDPLHVFLFEARRGHCEYFSTAMAVMLRTLGVPTRNVTGFVGGELNRYGRYYALRNGDAHSWVEVHIDGRWRAFDPTPSAAREAAGGSSNGNVRAFLDALRVRWARSVVGYDLRSQAELLRSTLALVRGIRSSTASPGAGPTFTERARAAGPSGAVQLVGGSVAVAVVGLAFFVIARRRRARRGEPDVVRLERA
ncbi:MAG: transglutaminase domain-containing protein, partial [Polyangiaceae bacterium]|nr:transglutaminase domain-containing protein [Polyangiaceae bacterium]